MLYMMHNNAPAIMRARAPIHWDYVSSAAHRLPLGRGVTGLGAGPVRAGEALLVRVGEPNLAYHNLELASGVTVGLRRGDQFVAIAGSRQALRGFVGNPPDRAQPGDRLSILSLGGIVGRFTGGFLDLGVPTPVEVIDRLGRDGRPLSMSGSAIPRRAQLGAVCPVVAVVGTSMSAGKTRAATELVASASAAGFRVAAVKLTGVACLRDVLGMREKGAFAAVSFLDAGLASTVDEPELSSCANGLLQHLSAKKPDLIVAELGDGILGPYGVDRLLQEPSLNRAIRALVLSASDHVGAWGGVELLRRWGLSTDVITGPVTDSAASSQLLEKTLGVPAVNACTEGHQLFDAVRPRLATMREP